MERLTVLVYNCHIFAFFANCFTRRSTAFVQNVVVMQLPEIDRYLTSACFHKRSSTVSGLVFEAHRLLLSLSLRLKDPLGPVTRVKKKKKK